MSPKVLTANSETLSPIVYFLLWAEAEDPNMMFGGYKAKDVVDSLAKLFNISSEKLRGMK